MRRTIDLILPPVREVLAGDVGDERRRRVVGEQPPQHLLGDEAGGARMIRHDVEDVEPVVDAAAGRNGCAEDELAAVVVPVAVVIERSWSGAGTDDGVAGRRSPAREAARDFDDVLLRVATVDAERVQLQELAGVILVRRPSRPSVALRVVEIDEHRRARRARVQHRREGAKRMLQVDVAHFSGLENAD